QIAVTKTATHIAAMASDAHISGTTRSSDQLGRSRATGGDPCDIVDMFHAPSQGPFSRQASPASSGKILTRRSPPADRHTRLGQCSGMTPEKPRWVTRTCTTDPKLHGRRITA